MGRAKRFFLSQPDPTDQYEELLLGKNIADGVVELTSDLKSPVRGLPCAGFFYEGVVVIPTRNAPTVHKMKALSAYAPFLLHMEGGAVRVVPSKDEPFRQKDHLELVEQYGAQYQAAEDIIRGGARVRVAGKLREEGGELVLTMKTIAVLEERAKVQTAAPRPNGKKGKKNNRTKKSKNR